MAFPELPNPTSPASYKQVQVAAGVGLAAFTGIQGKCSVQIRLHASGTLVYKNRFNETVTLTEMPAGVEAIEAISIEPGTTMKVTVYF